MQDRGKHWVKLILIISGPGNGHKWSRHQICVSGRSPAYANRHAIGGSCDQARIIGYVRAHPANAMHHA